MFFDDDDGAADAAELTKQTLVDTQQRMGAMLDFMPMGFVIHTRQGIIFANKEASRLLRIDQSEAVGRHFLDFLSTNSADADAQMEEAFAGVSVGRHTEIEIGNAEEGGVIIKLIAGPLPWEGNTVVQLLLQDITDLKKTEATLRRLTITDELTGAFNRRHAFTTGNLMIEAAARACSVISVIALDIDHFKAINDRYGHAGGDIALKRLAEIISEVVGELAPHGVFSRTGGEEFTLSLPEFCMAEASALAEILRVKIATTIVTIPDAEFAMTVSMGVGCLSSSDRDFASLLARADEALYSAKAAGRNCIICASMQPVKSSRAAA